MLQWWQPQMWAPLLKVSMPGHQCVHFPRHHDMSVVGPQVDPTYHVICGPMIACHVSCGGHRWALPCHISSGSTCGPPVATSAWPVSIGPHMGPNLPHQHADPTCGPKLPHQHVGHVIMWDLHVGPFFFENANIKGNKHFIILLLHSVLP